MSQNVGQHAGDLPQHARERLAEMRAKKLFTSDLSVSEFLLVKEAGFEPLGLVMGSSIYQIAPTIPNLARGQPGCEITDMTRALYHARELAMNRMEEEADELGADGVVGVRLTLQPGDEPGEAVVDALPRVAGLGARGGVPAVVDDARERLGELAARGGADVVALLLPARAGSRSRRRRGRGRGRRRRMPSGRTPRSSSPSGAR